MCDCGEIYVDVYMRVFCMRVCVCCALMRAARNRVCVAWFRVCVLCECAYVLRVCVYVLCMRSNVLCLFVCMLYVCVGVGGCVCCVIYFFNNIVCVIDYNCIYFFKCVWYVGVLGGVNIIINVCI